MNNVSLIIVLDQKEIDELHNDGSIWFKDGSCIIYTINGYIHHDSKQAKGTSCQIRIREEQA